MSSPEPAPAPATTSDPLGDLGARVRPLAPAAERTLPVVEALLPLLPAGLPRGATVAVGGAAGRSLAVALLAAATQAGSWVAVAGVGGFGWRAAGELGLHLARAVVVDPVPAAVAPDLLAALVDGFDAVLVGDGVRVPPSLARRLAARTRERGTVLVRLHEARPVATPSDDAADLRARADADPGWGGLGAGTGRLGGRQVAVHVEGKRLPGRQRRARLWLPGPAGGVEAVAPTEVVVPLAPVVPFATRSTA